MMNQHCGCCDASGLGSGGGWQLPLTEGAYVLDTVRWSPWKKGRGPWAWWAGMAPCLPVCLENASREPLQDIVLPRKCACALVVSFSGGNLQVTPSHYVVASIIKLPARRSRCLCLQGNFDASQFTKWPTAVGSCLKLTIYDG